MTGKISLGYLKLEFIVNFSLQALKGFYSLLLHRLHRFQFLCGALFSFFLTFISLSIFEDVVEAFLRETRIPTKQGVWIDKRNFENKSHLEKDPI